jgi:Cytochrome c3
MRYTIPTGMNRVLPLLAALVLALSLPAAAQEEIVCIQCHGAQTGRLGDPVKFWRESIHAANGIACNDCHGGDPKDLVNAMSPSRGFLGAPKAVNIPAFCGRCHVGVEKDYRQSAHGRALGKGGPTCVTCHSNHKVLKASLDIINEKTCTQCHTFERARIIRDAMRQTEEKIVAIDGKIAAFKEEGVDADRLEKGLFAVRNRFHALFHEVDVAKVKGASAQINGELNKLDTELAKIAAQHRKRKLAGAVVVGAALLTALFCYFLRKTFD